MRLGDPIRRKDRASPNSLLSLVMVPHGFRRRLAFVEQTPARGQNPLAKRRRHENLVRICRFDAFAPVRFDDFAPVQRGHNGIDVVAANCLPGALYPNDTGLSGFGERDAIGASQVG